MQLRLALLGALSEHTAANVNALEERLEGRPGPDKPEPQLTAGLVPVADKLIQALDEPNLGVARKYSEQLEVQIHAQLEIYLRKQVESDKTGDTQTDRYFNLSRQLEESLRNGDVAKAAVIATEVQSVQDAITSKKKLPMSMIGRNVYCINDALGRAAVLRKDYLAASDYLLKAADTPGADLAMRTFGPDLWLARALLTAGYGEVVLTFLERCKAFWSAARLDEWISTIKRRL